MASVVTRGRAGMTVGAQRAKGRVVTSRNHRTKLHYELFSDAYSASCTCGWRVSSCTDRERIVGFKVEHEREYADADRA